MNLCLAMPTEYALNMEIGICSENETRHLAPPASAVQFYGNVHPKYPKLVFH